MRKERMSDDTRRDSTDAEHHPEPTSHRGLLVVLLIFAGLLGLLIGSQVVLRG